MGGVGHDRPCPFPGVLCADTHAFGNPEAPAQGKQARRIDYTDYGGLCAFLLSKKFVKGDHL